MKRSWADKRLVMCVFVIFALSPYTDLGCGRHDLRLLPIMFVMDLFIRCMNLVQYFL